MTHEGQIQFRLYIEKGPKGPNVTKRHTTTEVFLESLHTYIGGTFLLTTDIYIYTYVKSNKQWSKVQKMQILEGALISLKTRINIFEKFTKS